METKEKRTHDVYQMVTQRIIKQLEQGKIPWKKPWNNSGLPENMVTRKSYRGVNVFLLAMLGYEKNYFLSQKQLKELGGTVKDGEKPHLITYWKLIEPQEGDEVDQKPFRVLRYYMVYNIAQCDGIPKDKIPGFMKPRYSVEGCKKILSEMPTKPEIRENPKENYAYYHPQFDYIAIPPYESFKRPEGYYGTLFHELIHWTGSASRLGRKELMEMSEFGSYTYSVEELTAEIGACYLKSLVGIPQRDLNNDVAYIQGWISKFTENSKILIYAATLAQKAVDYILNVTYEDKNSVITDDVEKS